MLRRGRNKLERVVEFRESPNAQLFILNCHDRVMGRKKTINPNHASIYWFLRHMLK